MSGYHFHKDCKYYPECTEEPVKAGKHELILFRCPRGNDNRGSLYYKSDLHTIKDSCPVFEPMQTSLFDTQEER